MDDDSEPVAEIAFLARSETRVRVLEHLLVSEAGTQRELRDELDTSRSTVARSLNALEDRDWVAAENGTYRLTAVGKPVIESFLGVVETVRTTGELAPFLRWFPLSEHDLDVADLHDAEITARTDGEPYAPGRRQTDFLRNATRFRGVLPSLDLEGTKLVHEQITDGTLEAEIVVPPAVVDTINSGEFAGLFREKFETGRLTVLAAADPLPFYLGLADGDGVQVGVEDDEGFPRALLDASGGAVREWGERVYADVRSRADELDGIE